MSASSTQKPRVLIVDDEHAINVAFDRLYGNGWDVETATDPVIARERLLSPELFDAVLLDVVMPHIRGIDLFVELKRLAPNRCRRILFITSFADPLVPFFEEHGCLWVEKPFIGPRGRQLEALVTMMAEANFPRGP
jgi:DNA-binding response OmpR family regulator